MSSVSALLLLLLLSIKLHALRETVVKGVPGSVVWFAFCPLGCADSMAPTLSGSPLTAYSTYNTIDACQFTCKRRYRRDTKSDGCTLYACSHAGSHMSDVAGRGCINTRLTLASRRTCDFRLCSVEYSYVLCEQSTKRLVRPPSCMPLLRDGGRGGVALKGVGQRYRACSAFQVAHLRVY